MTSNITKFMVLLTVVVLGFLVMTPIANAQATKRRQRTASGKTSVPAKRTNKSTTPSLDEQAFALIMNFWLKPHTRCGDSYIGVGDSPNESLTGLAYYLPSKLIHQVKGEIVMDRVDLTEADRLNGVEYLAIAHFNWSVYREKSSGTWSPWEANRHYEPSPRFTSRGRDSVAGLHVRKMNGQWEVYWNVENSYQLELWLKYPPPPCSVLQD